MINYASGCTVYGEVRLWHIQPWGVAQATWKSSLCASLMLSYYEFSPEGYKFRMQNVIAMATTTQSHKMYTKEGWNALDKQ